MASLKFENSIVDNFLRVAACSKDSDVVREKVFNDVSQTLCKILQKSVKILPFGSGPLKTYLPESDIDITLMYDQNGLTIDDSNNHSGKYTVNVDDLNAIK